MLGKPKYKVDDKVTFQIEDTIINGKVYVVDRFGVLEDDTDVHYDILGTGDPKYITKENPKGECLYKHIREDNIINNK